MAREPRRCQKGFTLLELLVTLAIIGIFWGVGMSAKPRLPSGSGPASLARRLAGAGQEARQMALLQQRPWELLIDLDQGVFYRAPLGAVDRRELRASGALGSGSLDPAGSGGSASSSSDAQRGEASEQDLIAQRQEELKRQPDTLRATRSYDSLAFGYEDTDSDIVATAIPEEVKIIQIWIQDGHAETEGRVSLVFGPRGFARSATVWLEDADSPGKDRYTVHFPGIVPPVAVGGIFLPDDSGVLTPAELLP